MQTPAFGPEPHAHWHAQSAAQVLQALAVDPAQGLSPDAVVQRLRTHGHNRLPAVRGLPAWRRFLLQFHNPLIYVLLIAGGVTLALRSHVDAVVILAVVLINALIGFVQEG
ncbi:cation-transporting P-type ATPase [Limnohabitans sp.]|uniref:cation-transporting P-type ATPase n=1 Tax=Limnohabitans sp. TaxID=1907725 RepID=UPI0025BA3536|nr:cation-transporting P-type ATPase [Limnohabitans sp.]